MEDPVAFVAALMFLIGFSVFVIRGFTQTCKGVNKGVKAANKWCDKQIDGKN